MSGRLEGRYFFFGLFIFVIVSLIVLGGGIYHGAANNVAPIHAQGLCDPNNLTGKWIANDRGTYFARQIGNTLWWFGASKLQEGTIFSNVLRGTIYFPPANNTKVPYIEGNWQDVPLGNTRGEGKIFLSVDPSGQKLTKIGSYGDIFGGSEWIKNCRSLPDIIKRPAPAPFVK
jgi:hypothetical protein